MISSILDLRKINGSSVFQESMRNRNRPGVVRRYFHDRVLRSVFLLLLGVVLVTGCRGPKVKGLAPVRGTVTYQGKPLEGATVNFTPMEFKSGDRVGVGLTDEKGRFELRTIGESGILPNEYRVIVVKNQVTPEKTSSPSASTSEKPTRPAPRNFQSVIPKRYNDAKTSGLSFIVGKEGLADVRIDLVD